MSTNLAEATTFEARGAQLEATAAALREEAERNGVFNSYDEIGKRVQKLDLNSRRCHRLAAGEVLRPDCQREFETFMAEFQPIQTNGGAPVHAPDVATPQPPPHPAATGATLPQPSPLAPSAVGATLPKVSSEEDQIAALARSIAASDGPAPTDESDPEIAALARSIAESDLEDDDEIAALAKSIAAA